jgi:hypothetical protein
MVVRTSYANHDTPNQQTAFGVTALKPIVLFQVSWLRIWAVSLERLAENYEKGLEETANILKTQPERAPWQMPDIRQAPPAATLNNSPATNDSLRK